MSGVLSRPQSPVERPASPENCCICLQGIDNKAFADSCVHKFCFKCLKTWSTEKPVCPLCKTVFRSILHNVRKDDDYDVYSIPERILARTFVHEMLNTSHSPPASVSATMTLSQNTQSPPRSSLSNVLPVTSSTVAPVPERIVPNVRREDVYRYMLIPEQWPTGDPFGRTSAIYYSQNREEMNKLIPFIKRELRAIRTLGCDMRVREALAVILEVLPRFNIRSPQFFSAMTAYTHTYTEKFVQELERFAKSSYDVIADYDAATSYRVRGLLPVRSASPSRSHSAPRSTPRTSSVDDQEINPPPVQSPTEQDTNSAGHNRENRDRAVRTLEPSVSRWLHGSGISSSSLNRNTNTRDTYGMNLDPTYTMGNNFGYTNAGYAHGVNLNHSHIFGNSFDSTNTGYTRGVNLSSPDAFRSSSVSGNTGYTRGMNLGLTNAFGTSSGSANAGYTHGVNLNPTDAFGGSFGSANPGYTQYANLNPPDAFGNSFGIGDSASGSQSVRQSIIESSSGERDAVVISNTEGEARTNARAPSSLYVQSYQQPVLQSRTNPISGMIRQQQHLAFGSYNPEFQRFQSDLQRLDNGTSPYSNFPRTSERSSIRGEIRNSMRGRNLYNRSYSSRRRFNDRDFRRETGSSSINSVIQDIVDYISTAPKKKEKRRSSVRGSSNVAGTLEIPMSQNAPVEHHALSDDSGDMVQPQ